MKQELLFKLPLPLRIRSYLDFILSDYTIHPKLTVQIWKHVIEEQQLLIPHWELLLNDAQSRQELKPDISVETWSHIINGLVSYGLHTFNSVPSKSQLLIKVMALVQESLEAIIEKKGDIPV